MVRPVHFGCVARTRLRGCGTSAVSSASISSPSKAAEALGLAFRAALSETRDQHADGARALGLIVGVGEVCDLDAFCSACIRSVIPVSS